MKTSITQYTILLVALFFINFNLTAQTGDFEFLFETDGDLEGFQSFGTGGTSTVASGRLTFTYGSSTSGIELNPPSTNIYIDKNNYKYLAIKLSGTPSLRRYMYCKTSAGGWYGNKANPPADVELDAANIFYYDISGDNFPTSALPDGLITRIIFNFEDATESSIDIDWIKTFESREAIIAYAGLTLGLDDIDNKFKTKIISSNNKIDIKNCELNAKIEVFNLAGVLVNTTIAVSSDFSIPIYYKGVYIVKISVESLVDSTKVIVY